MAPHGCSLRKLWIVNCDVGSAGCRALAAALFCNDGLVELNCSGNRIQASDHHVLVQAAAENTRLRALICRDCGLSEDMERALAAAVKTTNQGISWKEQCQVAGIAATLRNEVLNLTQERLMAVPRLPSLKPLMTSHRRFARSGAEQPVWRRHEGPTWSNDDIDALVAGPIPLGEGFASLARLSSELHDAEAGLQQRINDLSVRAEVLASTEAIAQAKLSANDEVKRALAEAYNTQITAATYKARQAQLRAEQLEKELKNCVNNQLEYENSVHSARKLVKDFKAAASRVLPAGGPIEKRLKELSQADSKLARQLQSSLTQLKISEERRYDWSETLMPRAREAFVSAKRFFESKKAELDSTLFIARDGTSSAQHDSDELIAVVEASSTELAVVRQNLIPARGLLSRLADWHTLLDNYLEKALEAEEWKALVPVSCGDEAIDDRLRRAIRREQFRSDKLEESRAAFAAATEHPVSTSYASSEVPEMAAEDVYAQALLSQLATQNARRIAVEHKLVKAHPMTEDSFRPQSLELLFIRAQKPIGESHAAFVVDFAANAQARALAEMAASKRKLGDKALSPPRPEVSEPLPEQQRYQDVVSAARHLVDAISCVRMAGTGRSGDAARAELRRLTAASGV